MLLGAGSFENLMLKQYNYGVGDHPYKGSNANSKAAF
jgi:hypothetical protein